jgi:outer membrane protein
MKKVLCGFVLLGLLIVAPLSYAAEMKIGYFDMDRVLTQSQRGKKEMDAFLKRKAVLEKDLQKKVDELNTLRAELSKKDSLLNEQVRKNKEKDYQQKAKELDRLQTDAKIELDQTNREIMNRLGKILVKAVAKLGEDEKYSLIVDAGVLAYGAKELEITDKVIKAFDAAKE